MNVLFFCLFCFMLMGIGAIVMHVAEIYANEELKGIAYFIGTGFFAVGIALACSID